MALIVPVIIYAEKKAKLKPVFIAAVALLLIGQVSLALTSDTISDLVVQTALLINM